MPTPLNRRPAETAGAAVGTGGLVAGLAAHNWLAAVVAAAGYVPLIVTYIVTHHGVRGIARSLWVGNQTHN